MTNIRPACVEDAAAILSINHHVQQLHADALPVFFKAAEESDEARASFMRQLETLDHHFFIAEDQHPVGYVYARRVEKPENWMRPRLESLIINHVAVSPGARRRGVGTKLVERVFELALELRIERVEIDFWHFNESARQFFERMGFAAFHSRMQIFPRAERSEPTGDGVKRDSYWRRT